MATKSKTKRQSLVDDLEWMHDRMLEDLEQIAGDPFCYPEQDEDYNNLLSINPEALADRLIAKNRYRAILESKINALVDGSYGGRDDLRGFALAYVTMIMSEHDDRSLQKYCDWTDRVAESHGAVAVESFFFSLIAILPDSFGSDCGPFG